MKVGIDIDWLGGARRDGLFNHAVGLLSGLKEADLAAEVELYTWDRRGSALAPAAAAHLAGFTVRDFRHPRRLWRARHAVSPAADARRPTRGSRR